MLASRSLLPAQAVPDSSTLSGRTGSIPTPPLLYQTPGPPSRTVCTPRRPALSPWPCPGAPSALLGAAGSLQGARGDARPGGPARLCARLRRGWPRPCRARLAGVKYRLRRRQAGVGWDGGLGAARPRPHLLFSEPCAECWAGSMSLVCLDKHHSPPPKHAWCLAHFAIENHGRPGWEPKPWDRAATPGRGRGRVVSVLDPGRASFAPRASAGSSLVANLACSPGTSKRWFHTSGTL